MNAKRTQVTYSLEKISVDQYVESLSIIFILHWISTEKDYLSNLIINYRRLNKTVCVQKYKQNFEQIYIPMSLLSRDSEGSL